MLVPKGPKLSTTELNWGEKTAWQIKKWCVAKTQGYAQCRVLKVTVKALSPKYEGFGLIA